MSVFITIALPESGIVYSILLFPAVSAGRILRWGYLQVRLASFVGLPAMFIVDNFTSGT